MAIDQLSDDFVRAYADWLGVSFGEAYELLKEEPLEDVTGDRELQAAGWDESEHPREPEGTETGGQFAEKGTAGGGIRLEGDWSKNPARAREVQAVVDELAGRYDTSFKRVVARETEEFDQLAGKSKDTIYVSPRFLDDKYMDEHLRTWKTVSNTSTPADIVAHEFGHILDGELLSRHPDLYDRLNAFLDEKVELGDTGRMIPRVQSGLEAPSAYGSENRYEFVAEGFIDWYRNGEKAHPSSVFIGKLFDEGLRKKPVTAAAWDPAKHPRHAPGTPEGGEFAPKGVQDTFVGQQGFERGPGRVRIAGERPRTPVSEIFAQAPATSLEAAVSDWGHLREQRPDMETVDVSQLVPTQDVVSAVRVEEYLQELREDGNLPELLDSVRVAQGDDGRLYIADGHNRVAAAMRAGHHHLYLPVIRPERLSLQPLGWKRPERRPGGMVIHQAGDYTIETSKKPGFRGGDAFRVPAQVNLFHRGQHLGMFSTVEKAKARVERHRAEGLTAAGFEEGEHPRWPKGHPDGGQFRPKDELEEGQQPPQAGALDSVEVLGSARDPNWEGPALLPSETEFGGLTFDMVRNSDTAWRGELNPAMQYTVDFDYMRETIDRDYWQRDAPLEIGGDEWDKQLASYRADVEERMREVAEEGELRTTTTFEAMQSIMDEEPRFKTQFETASSGGVFSPPVRAAQEEMFFGYPQDMPPEQRPIYGWLDHPDGDHHEYDNYGEVTWFLKPELKARTTISFADSLSRPLVPGPIRDPGWRSTVPPGYHDTGMGFGGDVSDHVNETGLFDTDAIEVQYHGGLTLDDVQAVRVTAASWGAWDSADFAQLRDYRKRLAQRGIRLEVVNEDGEEIPNVADS